ncbi:methyltransferase domain-containing protein [Streptomyces sp. CB01580]|uniref:methyltransferase domain-containing protein n=1 Tax=Streptomyces sp. CB01580 TaxID=1703933 RepID=UPI000AE760C4|nr:methyltransferase domain-containing protein [Streptomyces sp. CB01580]
MSGDGRELGEAQREHWQRTYGSHPGMYGQEPSLPARHAAGVFREAGAVDVLELGAGHGRDALYFAREGFTVRALDFSAIGLEQLRADADHQGVGGRVTTAVHDVRDPLPLADASVDAVFAHMLLCMALSTEEIHAVAGEVRRVLRPGGVFVYTVRHTGDAHYASGEALGDDIYEHDGFAVHFFSRGLVDALAEGWTLNEVHAFEEGELPRRLWRVTQSLAREARMTTTPTPPAGLTVDGTGLLCVTLLLRLRKVIDGAEAGTVVHVIATDPAAPLDLPAWCHMTGHDYLGPVPGEQPVYALRLSADARPTRPDRPWHRAGD